MMMWISPILFTISLHLMHFPSTDARRHKLELENDSRKQIVCSTFGFLTGGYLSVTLSHFGSTSLEAMSSTNTFGFSLDKTLSSGISSYLNKEDTCVLDDPTITKDNSLSMIVFRMDLKNKRMLVERKGKDLRNIEITNWKETDYTIALKKSRSRANKSLNVHMPQKRSIPDDKNDKKSASDRDENSIIPEKNPVVMVPQKNVSSSKSASGAVAVAAVKPAVNASDSEFGGLINKSFPIQYVHGMVTVHFIVSIRRKEEEGLYNLFFHNCGNYGPEKQHNAVNFTLNITEKNPQTYLSAGDAPLPPLYFAFAIVYFLLGCFWFYVLRHLSELTVVYKIHYIMLALCYIKSIAFIFHGVNYYFIGKEGYQEEGWAVLYYITHLMKGALLFTAIVLIGAGWAFIKHMLSDREKKIFLIVIPLQILANVAQIIIEESEEGTKQFTLWTQVFILVDLLCCGAILFPVVWSIRHLTEASKVDGKAAINLQKLKLFRHFYILVVCYIYFTRIIVYLLQITVPFQFEFLTELFRELATLGFFVVTGYKFRPISDNPYLIVPQEEEDFEMDEILTESGALDTVTKVVRTANGQKNAMTAKKRESSHEYD
ncbi:protein GPR107-like isoform X2 [Tubulanus polymorphus]|uniref:protein GPR107-like isoform X2 n=1 Tax=Tubulanus polymorphus TaxID=672921 RepID=UPI003DA4E5D7